MDTLNWWHSSLASKAAFIASRLDWNNLIGFATKA